MTPPADLNRPHPADDNATASADAQRRRDELGKVAAAVAAAIEADGGTFEVLEVTGDGVVRCRLAGACGTCAVATSSTAAGLERILRGRFDWVTAVEVVVDEPATHIEGVGGWVPRLP